MPDFELGVPMPPEQPPSQPSAPAPVPWHDPGPPVREIDLPPNQPSPGVDVPNPERGPLPS